jgi:hypothetical protein
MKDEYDFAGAERGIFYKHNLRLILPVRIRHQLLDYLTKQAMGTPQNALPKTQEKTAIKLTHKELSNDRSLKHH